VSDDTPVAAFWRNARSLRIADGPDEVHKVVIAKRELKRFA
jgi:acyl-CoA dehydrogenase